MIITPTYLERKLAKTLGAYHVEAVDWSDGCKCRYSLLVVHDGFEGQGLLERHQSVYGYLREELVQIHALQLKTWTREQYLNEAKLLETSAQSTIEH
ncbi:hypothetical protein ABG067_007118 [Albugo candida]